MMGDSILEILLRAQKYAESLGGRFSARVIIWPSQIVNVHVDYEKIPGRRAGGFGIGVRDGNFKKLAKELERNLDYLFGPKWREAE
jgi:hypothetical protein